MRWDGHHYDIEFFADAAPRGAEQLFDDQYAAAFDAHRANDADEFCRISASGQSWMMFMSR